MHKAIVHIGTEKTGSTAIQNFLYKNESLLSTYGHYYPFQTCGLISNFRLAIYCLEANDPNLVAMDRRAANSPDLVTFTEDPDQWRDNFAEAHIDQIRTIHNRHKDTTVIYSSEHFHSRIVKPVEVERLHEFLDLLYDQVDIIAYFRRQDRLAVSSHNTSIQGGATNPFDFSNIEGKTNYFDYLSLMQRWADVFGAQHVRAKVYERDRLIGNDVGHDFKASTLSDEIISRLEKRPLHYERSNPRLSYTALKALLEFNRMDANDALLQGNNKPSIRQALITKLHDVNDEHGEMLPPRSTALEFYERFRSDNERVFNDYGKGDSFNENFSMFPETESDAPAVDALGVLTAQLNSIFAESNT